MPNTFMNTDYATYRQLSGIEEGKTLYFRFSVGDTAYRIGRHFSKAILEDCRPESEQDKAGRAVEDAVDYVLADAKRKIMKELLK